jgi:hypothetical protein
MFGGLFWVIIILFFINIGYVFANDFFFQTKEFTAVEIMELYAVCITVIKHPNMRLYVVAL